MFATAMVAILVSMTLALLRAALGPTVYDRVMAVNSFGTATVLFIAVLGFLNGRPDFLDLALVLRADQLHRHARRAQVLQIRRPRRSDRPRVGGLRRSVARR